MQLYPAALFRLFAPAAILGVALWSRVFLPALGSESFALVGNLPYLLCLVALVMAYQFNRSRLLLASLGVAAFYWAVQHALQNSLALPAVARSYLALSLALPLLGMYLLLLPERGVVNVFGLLALAGFLLTGLLAVYCGPLLPSLSEAAAQYYAPWSAEGYVLSRGATALCTLVIIIGLGLLVLRNEEAEAALLGALVALLLSLALLHYPFISVAMGTAAALCLLWGLLRSSHAMAYRDELTGIPGRRALNERVKMLGRRYTIAMLDVDHFKRFNDTHGHDVGDQVLRLVASRLRRVRGGTAFRYGGEEFCVVFPRRTTQECIEPIEDMRREIADYKMQIRDRHLRPEQRREGSRRRGATRLRNGQVAVTVSAGLAERSAEAPDPESVIKAADRKLYLAKSAGRNRVAW